MFRYIPMDVMPLVRQYVNSCHLYEYCDSLETGAVPLCRGKEKTWQLMKSGCDAFKEKVLALKRQSVHRMRALMHDPDFEPTGEQWMAWGCLGLHFKPTKRLSEHWIKSFCPFWMETAYKHAGCLKQGKSKGYSVPNLDKFPPHDDRWSILPQWYTKSRLVASIKQESYIPKLPLEHIQFDFTDAVPPHLENHNLRLKAIVSVCTTTSLVQTIVIPTTELDTDLYLLRVLQLLHQWIAKGNSIGCYPQKISFDMNFFRHEGDFQSLVRSLPQLQHFQQCFLTQQGGGAAGQPLVEIYNHRLKIKAMRIWLHNQRLGMHHSTELLAWQIAWSRACNDHNHQGTHTTGIAPDSLWMDPHQYPLHVVRYTWTSRGSRKLK